MKESDREMQQNSVNGKNVRDFSEHDFLFYFIYFFKLNCIFGDYIRRIINLVIFIKDDLVFEPEIHLKTKCSDRQISNTLCTDCGHLQITLAVFSRYKQHGLNAARLF